ncbi:MAG: helix-turn-helix domain-containing protein [Candidatus Nitrosocaldus sp.]
MVSIYTDGLDRLLFVLASKDRLTIMQELSRERLRLTDVAKRLNASVQEVSRHLSRLSSMRLIERDGNGYYRITMLGSITMIMLQQFRLVLEDGDYFLTHDISFLPEESIDGIGEIAEHEHSCNLADVLNGAEQIIEEAEEYLLLISDQVIIKPEFIAKNIIDYNKDVEIRAILGAESMSNVEYRRIKGIFHGKKVSIRFMDNIRFAMAINEKRAGLCFPYINGRIDFTYSFKSSDRTFHRWCKDTFEFYWASSMKSLQSYTDQASLI